MKLRELQLAEKEILQFIINVCRELDISFFLTHGSLLGAVRHNGFIPWDDDIDIIMPRPDYDFFVKNAQEKLPSHLFIQTHETDPEFLCSFAKVRNSKTTFVEKSMMFHDINHGVFVDVFPLDGFPENKIEQYIFRVKNLVYSLRLGREFYVKQRSLKWKIASGVARILCPSAEKTLKKQDELFRVVDYSSAHWVSNCLDSNVVLDKTVYETDVLWNFEGIEVKIPIGYDEYLTKMYGEYMTLPKEADRIPHHNSLMCDLSCSYLDNKQMINSLAQREIGL